MLEYLQIENLCLKQRVSFVEKPNPKFKMDNFEKYRISDNLNETTGNFDNSKLFTCFKSTNNLKIDHSDTINCLINKPSC